MKETLKALRENFNYSQNSVAQFLGISRQMYIKYENGEVEPPVKIVTALSGLYKVPYEVIIDNKMISHSQNDTQKNLYDIPDQNGLKVADSGMEYSAENIYFDTIVEMFKKLVFVEQVKVFAELAGEIQKHSDQIADSMLETKKEKDPLQEIWDRTEKTKTGSKGWKWNREELYDREICKHRGE